MFTDEILALIEDLELEPINIEVMDQGIQVQIIG